MVQKTGEGQEKDSRGGFANAPSEVQESGARSGLDPKTGEDQGTGTRGGFAEGHRGGQEVHGEPGGQDMEVEQGDRDTEGRVEVDRSVKEEGKCGGGPEVRRPRTMRRRCTRTRPEGFRL